MYTNMIVWLGYGLAHNFSHYNMLPTTYYHYIQQVISNHNLPLKRKRNERTS